MDGSNGSAPRYWVGVASQEHVGWGLEGGFAQFCHGKQGPARRPRRGDFIIYYSGKVRMGDPEVCQKFTALGRIADEEPRQVEQFPGFFPWRRTVEWQPTRPAAVRPLVPRLSFLAERTSWGQAFRFGFLEIPAEDGRTIAAAMAASV